MEMVYHSIHYSEDRGIKSGNRTIVKMDTQIPLKRRYLVHRNTRRHTQETNFTTSQNRSCYLSHF
jgi:hypothetical protein